MGKPILYVVVPCFNEEEVLIETSKRLSQKLESLYSEIDRNSRILFVDDGSMDQTWNIICRLHRNDKKFNGIKLSRNCGHQNALLAGLITSQPLCDITISLDADLQDDIDIMDKMIRKYGEGADIVYGVRNKRDKDTPFKRWTAESFYKIMKFLGADTIYNHADYRLMSRRALEGLARFEEVNLFLRGLVPMIGYKSDIVFYERKERFAGKSKYPLKKMLAFAFEGITSLSTRLIRGITIFGIVIFFLSIVMVIYSVSAYFKGTVISGWASVMTSIWFIGGLAIFSIGLVGEYVGKVYLETKKRPRYIIEEFLSDE